MLARSRVWIRLLLLTLIGLLFSTASAMSEAGGRSLAASPATEYIVGLPGVQKDVLVPSVTVTIDRNTAIGVSQLQTGVSHTQHSADYWNNPQAVASARNLLRSSTHYQNQRIMGWGVGNPNPAPGVYDWVSLDDRINLIRQTGGTPVIQLAAAPDWMKGGAPGTTDWSRLEVAPRREHYADFAELARQAALRYPDVKYFIVWNELMGMWNASLNRWDYEAYTDLYNMVYDALKSVSPDIKVGGPYVILSSGNSWTMSHPTDAPALRNQPYGTIDQRALDVVTYWLSHKRGADFIVVDGDSYDIAPADPCAATRKFADVDVWLRQATSLPIWWAEWYISLWPVGGVERFDHPTQNVLMTLAMMHMARTGVAAELRFQPQGVANEAYAGSQHSLWSDTRRDGGGQPFPFYFSTKALHDHFGPGTTLYRATSSSPDVDVLASATHVLLVNSRSTPVTISLNGVVVTLGPREVRLL